MSHKKSQYVHIKHILACISWGQPWYVCNFCIWAKAMQQWPWCHLRPFETFPIWVQWSSSTMICLQQTPSNAFVLRNLNSQRVISCEIHLIHISGSGFTSKRAFWSTSTKSLGLWNFDGCWCWHWCRLDVDVGGVWDGCGHHQCVLLPKSVWVDSLHLR